MTSCWVQCGWHFITFWRDDLVLLALQQLLNVFSVHIVETDTTCNVNKTICMMFPPKNRTKLVSNDFRKLHIVSFCA